VTEPTAFTYIVTSTGTARRASNGQISSERVIAEFVRFDLYDMNLSAGSDGTDMFGSNGIRGNSEIFGPFYTGRGIDTSRFTGGPLFVGGNVTGGTFTGIATAYVAGTGGTTIGAATLVSSIPKMPALPAIGAAELQAYVDLAKAESVDNLAGDTGSASAYAEAAVRGTPGTYNTVVTGRAGGYGGRNYPYYKYIGPTGALAGATAVTINANLETGSFGKVPASPSGTSSQYDDFAWDAKQKVLYVNGTVFVDGPLTIEGRTDVKYMGNGTIVANGPIRIVCNTFGPFDGLKTDPDTGLNHQDFNSNRVLGFVSTTSIYLEDADGNPSKERDSDPGIVGAFYCKPGVQFANNLMVAGSVITDKMIGPNSGNNVHIRNSPNLKEFAPQSLPGRKDGLMGFTRWIRK
jgi:hypothetical protein